MMKVVGYLLRACCIHSGKNFIYLFYRIGLIRIPIYPFLNISLIIALDQ
jgi:hypothetical protein